VVEGRLVMMGCDRPLSLSIQSTLVSCCCHWILSICWLILLVAAMIVLQILACRVLSCRWRRRCRLPPTSAFVTPRLLPRHRGRPEQHHPVSTLQRRPLSPPPSPASRPRQAAHRYNYSDVRSLNGCIQLAMHAVNESD